MVRCCMEIQQYQGLIKPRKRLDKPLTVPLLSDVHVHVVHVHSRAHVHIQSTLIVDLE